MKPSNKLIKLTTKRIDKLTKQFMREKPQYCEGHTVDEVRDTILNAELMRAFKRLEKQNGTELSTS